MRKKVWRCGARRRKRLVRDRVAEPRLIRANQEWAMDFIVDGLANGRMVRILSVVDAYTRECLALEADTSLGSGRVTRVLDRLIEERGRPENVRSDNGPEFTSRRMLGWAEELQGRAGAHPARAAHAERPCRELPRQAARRVPQRKLVPHAERRAAYPGNWRQEYNCERPHSSLDYRTPAEFRQQPWAMEMWKAKNASHIPTAPTTTAARYSRPQTKTEKLQLSAG